MFVEASEIAGSIVRRQKTIDEVWDFLLRYYQVNRTSPVIREICEAMDVIQEKEPGTTSKNTIRAHLNTLIDRGLIEIPQGGTGGFRLPGKIIVVKGEWRYNG
jgi:hypothetical protein